MTHAWTHGPPKKGENKNIPIPFWNSGIVHKKHEEFMPNI